MPEEKKGPKRKKHRNSKLGCATCKRRRVKCMENLPACTNCIKHRVHCEYLDYSEAQIEEFKRAKRAHQAEQEAGGDDHPLPPHDHPRLDQLSIAESGIHSTKPIADVSVASGGFYHGTATHGAVTGDHDLQLDEDILAETRLTPPDPVFDDSMHSSELNKIANPLPSRLRGGLSDVLDFRSSSITQNFNNLLPEQVGEIIYPVYQINSTPEVEGPGQPQSAGGGDDYTPSGPFGAVRDVFLTGLDTDADTLLLSQALPNAIRVDRLFVTFQKPAVDYVALLFRTVGELNPQISNGTALWDNIRHLYHIWLCYFICKGFTLSVMFLCLTNLTTNYLITNVFQTSDSAKFDALVTTAKLRNTLVVHLIQHYAHVIKLLLALLHRNGDPEMAASISYILSLMAIYDPEATAYSTKCFRDGMFSVLSYTLHLAQRNNVAPPRLIPIHLHLMTNVARTVYLPAYDSSFLFEYERMLSRFGAILQEVSAGPVSNHETLAFVNQEYHKLWLFCQKTLRTYIPQVNENLNDIKEQEKLFFTMFHEWASLQPSRLLMVQKSTDPLEKVLNLFCRLFRKAMFAVMPQVRFFYLRDFDSPLMLDVFVINKDPDVFGELDFPEKLCISPDLYNKFKDELKVLASYSIRVITFLILRLSVLYRNLVYHDKVRKLYPIKNVVEWRNSITDIKHTRDEFHERIGLLEYPILSFKNTYITALHFPQIIDPAEPSARLTTPQPPEVDLVAGGVDHMSMQPHGLLALDSLPA